MEDDIWKENIQWHCIEKEIDREYVVLAVARTSIVRNPDEPVATIVDILATNSEILKADDNSKLTYNVLSYFLKHMEFVFQNIGVTQVVFEVLQSNEVLQTILDQYGYLENGGYLADPPISEMIFKYMKDIRGTGSIISIASPKEDISTETSSAVPHSESLDDDDDILSALSGQNISDMLGGQASDGGNEGLGDVQMESLMKDLFQALHNNKDNLN